MTKIVVAIIVVALTAAAAQAMVWDHFRKSTNIEDRRQMVAERPKPVTELVARNWIPPREYLPAPPQGWARNP